MPTATLEVRCDIAGIGDVTYWKVLPCVRDLSPWALIGLVMKKHYENHVSSLFGREYIWVKLTYMLSVLRLQRRLGTTTIIIRFSSV